MLNMRRSRLSGRFYSVLALSLFMSLSPFGAANPSSAAPKKAVKQTKAKKPAASEISLENGRKALLDSKFAQAEASFRKALAESEKEKNSKNNLDSMAMLCESLEAQRRLGDSLPLRNKALALALKKYGAESGPYVKQLAGMSCYYTKKGSNAKAWEYIEKGNAAIAKAGGSHANPLAASYLALATGRIQALEGSRGLADMSYKKALGLRESKLKQNSMPVLLLCKEYAKLLTEMERVDEAKKFEERLTVASAVDSGASEDTSTPDKVTDVKNSAFGKLLVEAKKAEVQKDNDKALALWKKAAQISEKSGKKGRLAYVLFKMGDSYSMKQQKDKAKALYKRSATIRESINAKDTIGMARVLTRLANYEIVDKNYQEAKRLLNRALEIEAQKKASDIMVETTLRSLSSVCMMTKDFSKGQEVCRRLLSLAERDNSPAAPMKKAMTTSMLAGMYMQSGRTQEGLSMMKSVSGQMTPQATKEYAKANQELYRLVEKEADRAEEKRLGIM